MTTAQHRRVTAADVARSLGLSRATVGFVLNNTPGQTISAATRERVLAEAERLGYRPHSAARALASGRSHIVLVVLPEWPLDFALRRNIEEAAAALDDAGYSMITYTPHAMGHARPLWETLQPDVVISMSPWAPERIQQLRFAGVRNIVPDPDRFIAEEYPEPGPGLQIEHLASLGHTRVGFVGSADGRVADLVELRRDRARAAAAERGIDLVSSENILLDEGQATAAVEQLRTKGATGVVAYNDDVAVALLGAALRSGVSVPEELAIIGHDDTPVAALIQPRLSTVRMDVSGLGRYLAGIALSQAEGRPAPDAEPVRHIEVVRRDTT